MNEAETRTFLIDPVIIPKGWNYQAGTLRLERTLGANGFDQLGNPCKLNGGRVDYLLRLNFGDGMQLIPIAFIEAKRKNMPVTQGLDQAINYAKFHHVPFVFATNGDQFIEHDRSTGLTSSARLMAEFPTHDELCHRYLQVKTKNLHAAVLTIPYSSGESDKIRYYQDAAIRAVLEKVALCEQDHKPKRVLLSLATGTGKTRLATNLLKRISEAGLLEKALFVCDRDELRTQGYGALTHLFSSNVQIVTGNNPQKNARVLVATYHTLGVDDGDSDSFLERNYPEDYFSHIIIDECHRSGFGKWSAVLKRNANAVQIGLTATPRQLKTADTDSSIEDEQISADNYAYFGEPVYEYDLMQAVEDGYLAACQIIQNHVLILNKDELHGLTKDQLANAKVENYCSGSQMDIKELKERYAAAALDRQIMLPERTHLLCSSLFQYLIAEGSPEQKTIIFCAGVPHAQSVAVELNNLYAQWCQQTGHSRAESFAFPCTGEVGRDNLADFKGMKRSHFIATTADFLQAGVDIPWVVNIVFFGYINSAIRFYQMVGRGTRLHAESEKIAFKIYDYTNATRLFGADFITQVSKPSNEKPNPQPDPEPEPMPEPTPMVTGLNIQIQKGENSFVVVGDDGKHTRVSFTEYKDRIKHLLLERLPTASAFVDEWITQSKNLLELPEIQTLLKYKEPEMDSFDVLLATAYQIPPKTKHERVTDFLNNSEAWFATMPDTPANTLRALANVFDDSGTEGLGNSQLFNRSDLKKISGGNVFNSLNLVGKPSDVFKEFKTRIFTLTH